MRAALGTLFFCIFVGCGGQMSMVTLELSTGNDHVQPSPAVIDVALTRFDVAVEDVRSMGCADRGCEWLVLAQMPHEYINASDWLEGKSPLAGYQNGGIEVLGALPGKSCAFQLK
jgi:hypothetical protein